MPRQHDDDEDDNRPRRRKRDDDDDEDDDRPRRGKKKARGKGGPSWILYAGIGGGLLAVVAAVAVVIVLSKGKKDGGGNDTTGPGGTGANGGGDGTGGAATPPPAGEMGGVIGAVDGMKPVILKPSPEAPGVAFRLPIHEGYDVHYAVLPPQPSDFLALVFVYRDRFSEPLATAVDRRTGRPIGKKVNLLPEFSSRPRPPIGATRPDLSADGTLLSTHKNSMNDKWESQPVQVWDVASGKLIKEVAVAPGTVWQGWTSPDRLMSLNRHARLDAWSYPAGTHLAAEGPETGPPLTSFIGPSLPGPGQGGTPRFAVTADHRKMALPRTAKTPRGDRMYYAILDTTTARELGQIPTLQVDGYLNMIGFSPDGTRLAYVTLYEDQAKQRNTGLFIVDGTTGTGPGPFRLTEPLVLQTHLIWWGPDLVLLPTSIGEFPVLDPATGQIVAKLKPGVGADGGAILHAADGRLWAKLESRVRNDFKGSYICAFDPTPEIRSAKGMTFELTPDGLRPLTK